MINSRNPSTKVGVLGKTASVGVALSILQSMFGRVLLLVSQLVLAKLLIPDDFGIFGLATTISTVFGVLTNIGIDQVLQQRHFKMRFWTTQAFTLSFGLSLVACVTMILFAPIGARFYHSPQITTLIWIMAVNLPIGTLSLLPEARLKKDLRYKFMVGFGAFELLATQTLMIVFAWCGMGSICFVLPSVIVSTIRSLVFWYEAPVKLRPFRLSKGWKNIFARSRLAFGSTLLNTAISQGDYATLGVLASTHVVGVYFFAFRLAAQPVRMLASNFVWALRPALIAINGERDRQNQIALKTAKLLGLLTVPACYLQAAIAKPGIVYLFGNRWTEAIPLIQILSLTLPFDSISWIAGCLLEARGQFNRVLKLLMISAPIFFGLVIGGALTSSSLGVAVAVAIYYAIHPLLFTSFVFFREKLPAHQILSCFATPALLGLPTIGGAYLLSLIPILGVYPLLQIAVTLSVGGLSYLLAVRIFLPDMFKDLWSKLRSVLRK